MKFPPDVTSIIFAYTRRVDCSYICGMVVKLQWYDALRAYLYYGSHQTHVHLLCCASRYGTLEMVQWIHRRVKFTHQEATKAFHMASNVHIAKYLHREFGFSKEDVESGKIAWVTALGNGYLEVAQWMIDHFQLTKQEMADRSLSKKMDSKLHSVSFATDEFQGWHATWFAMFQNCVEMAFLDASLNDHLREAQWILDYFDSHFDSNVQDLINAVFAIVCIYAQLNTMEWLVQRHGATLTKEEFHWVLKRCCYTGNMDAIEWLTSRYDSYCHEPKHYESYLAGACKWGHLPVVQWVTTKWQGAISPDAKRDAFVSACGLSTLETAKWIHESLGITAQEAKSENNRAFKRACEFGSLSLLNWMHQTFKIEKDEDAFWIACRDGRKDVACWLYQTFDFAHLSDDHNRITDCFVESCEYGRLKMAKWLCETFGMQQIAQAASQAFYLACIGNHVPVVIWLHDQFSFDKETALEAFVHTCRKLNADTYPCLALETLQCLHKWFSFTSEDISFYKDWILDKASAQTDQRIAIWICRTFPSKKRKKRKIE